jgi:TM2 domain-containing membrane protein YozV
MTKYSKVRQTLPEKKSITVAVLLNFFIPGTGYMYMGKIGLGITALLMTALLLIEASITTYLFVWAIMNVIMAIDMLLIGRKQQKEISEIVAMTTKVCPKYAETIKVDALVCRFCGADVSRVL